MAHPAESRKGLNLAFTFRENFTVFSIALLLRPEMTENFRARLCPGTPLMFRTLEEAQSARSELTIDSIRLADYQLKDSPPGQTMISILH
jgi:hypothetical protein